MTAPIINVRDLSKLYRLGGTSRPSRDLRDAFNDLLRVPLKRLRSLRAEPTTDDETFWALKDISFEVARGEVLGVIGKNGAGKSTLLKILSRITAPTEGRIELRGRVASLLEVGTGFHADLTGRENIYLNGTFLGMRKREIDNKFDEILAFAEIERFIDTPVKRYSSGMYVRLAFAVAAHLEPEILIVDEVLAVGDTAFQKKCLGKMKQVSRDGRTVILVTHNLGAIQTLCTKVLYLRQGATAAIGEVDEVLHQYSADTSNESMEFPRSLDSGLTLCALELRPNPVESGKGLDFQIVIEAARSREITDLALLFYSDLGTRVAIVDLRKQEPLLTPTNKALKIRGTIDVLPVIDGHYRVGIYIVSGTLRRNFLDLAYLTVSPIPRADGMVPYASRDRGVLSLNYTFEVIG